MDERIVRHMAIVASGYPAVAAVLPGGIVRNHDVAVDAGPWIIRQIGSRVGNMQSGKAQTTECASGHEDQRHPVFRGAKKVQDTADVSSKGHGLWIVVK